MAWRPCQKIWILVPDNIRVSKSLSEFKTKIKKWKFTSVPVGYANPIFRTLALSIDLVFFIKKRPCILTMSGTIYLVIDLRFMHILYIFTLSV